MIGPLALLAGVTLTGAWAAIALGVPVPLLTGPAIATTLASLAGLKLAFPKRLRSAVFLLAGIAIGATVSAESVSALARWPVAFAILGVAVIAMILLGQRLMGRLMRTDAHSALLAATPGHLSFVIALGEDLGLATDRVSVVQSIRLLALTLLVPFAVRVAGIETGVGLAPRRCHPCRNDDPADRDMCPDRAGPDAFGGKAARTCTDASGRDVGWRDRTVE